MNSKRTAQTNPDDVTRQGLLDEISHQVELWELKYLVVAKMKLQSEVRSTTEFVVFNLQLNKMHFTFFSLSACAGASRQGQAVRFCVGVHPGVISCDDFMRLKAKKKKRR